MLAALRDHPFLSEMPVSSLRRLANHAYRAVFAPGESIFREGGPADRFFLIRRGLVRLDIEVPGRGRVDLETLGADAALGWSWLLAPYRWHLSATAVQRTSMLVFDASMLRALMAADPVLGYEMMRRFNAVMFDRLQATRARCADHDLVALPEAAVAGPWAGIKAMVPSLT
jgi:CRP-like cAMP-binding protein